MKKMSALLLTVMIGCGGGSSVDSSEKLVDLSASQQTDVCNDVVADSKMRTITCGSGSDTSTITIDAETLAQCQSGLSATIAANPGCGATVGDAEDCISAEASESDADICAGTAIAACAALGGSDCDAQ